MRYRRSTLHQPVEDEPRKLTFRTPRRSTESSAAPMAAPTATPTSTSTPMPAPISTPTKHPASALANTHSGSTSGSVHGSTPDSVGPGTGLLDIVPDADDLTGLVDVVGITEVTHDVSSFELHAPWMESVDFEPGQYVTMRIPELGLERCYSISSAPFGTNTFTITVKRVAGGIVSSYLHDSIRVGDRVHVDGPYGLFSTSFHPARRHLFLSAGSGITPIMSMVRSLLARPMPRRSEEPTDIVFVHSASTPADIVFRPELEQLAAIPEVTVVILCSRDSEAEIWNGRRGRLTAETLAEVVPDPADRETFVCGPAGYMEAVRPLLAEVGVADQRLHEESFVFATTPKDRLSRAGARSAGARSGDAGIPGARTPAASTATDACHAIDFTLSGARVECDPATTVLDAAAEAGLSFPSSCEEGKCGTCKSLLVSGEVEMNHAGGIRPKEIAAGKFLPCCSTPLTDIVVER